MPTVTATRVYPPSGGEWADTFVLGTTEPVDGVNVGAGIYQSRPVPTTTVTEGAQPSGGTVTFNATTAVYTVTGLVEDLVIPGFVDLADGARLLNCLVTGPATEKLSARALVRGPSTTGQARVDFCTIDPTVASAYYNGIGVGVLATRTVVRNVVDGVQGFSTSTAGARIRGEGCVFYDPAKFFPDYGYGGGSSEASPGTSRPETHNDTAVQLQGNPYGTDADIVLDGCSGDARFSWTKGTVARLGNGVKGVHANTGALPASGNTTGDYRVAGLDLYRWDGSAWTFVIAWHSQISSVMHTPQTGVGAVHATITRCWLRGGAYCFNGGSGTLASTSSLVITDNRFERPGTDQFAPAIALVLDAAITNRTVSGNTYIDNGAVVPVTAG